MDDKKLIEQRLIELFNENSETERERLRIINGVIEDPEKMSRVILALRGINSTYFKYYAFIENDIQRSKNYLYKTGMVYAYWYEILKMEIFGGDLNTFTFPILSDSHELIERYLGYSYTEYYDSFNTHFSKGLQSILKEDIPALEKHIDGLKRRSKRGWEKQYMGFITSFEGFYNNDQEQITVGIYEVLKTNKKQRPNSMDYQYINYEATTIAKLAWRKGMEIEIDNPLVPKELLPVKELEHYEGYDFFDELKNKNINEAKKWK